MTDTVTYPLSVLKDQPGVQGLAQLGRNALERITDLERDLAETREQLRLCNVDQFTTAAELAEAKRNYMDLIMSVEKKYSNETRHQTALRYIRERETPSTDQAKCSAMKEGGK